MAEIHIANTEIAQKVTDDYCELHFPLRFEKSKRFLRENDRKRSITAGILLVEVLGIREEQIRLNEFGKPFLTGDRKFSLSHSGEYAVLAISDREIGVDIEEINPDRADAIKRVLTESEKEWLCSKPPEEIFSLWTLKEAVSKAVGMGMSIPFDSFDVLPLICGDSISVCGMELFGKTLKMNGYALSVSGENVNESTETKIFTM